MSEPKKFNENWFMPDERGESYTSLNDTEKRELEWWCRHYKESTGHLIWRMMEYFASKDEGDEKRANMLEDIIRTNLPYYWESVNR